MRAVYSPGNKKASGLTGADDFGIAVSSRTTSGTSSAASSGAVADAIYNEVTYSAGTVEHTLSYVRPLLQAEPAVALVSGPATISGNVVSGNGNGSCIVEVTGRFGKRQLVLPTSVNNGYSVRTYSGATSPGSLSKACLDKVAAYFAGKPKNSDSVLRYTDVSPALTAAGFTATKNPNLAVNDIDLSWLSMWRIYPSAGANYNGYQAFPCALISPRHAVMAAHVGFAERMIFQRADGTFVQADVVSNSWVASHDGSPDDVSICYFSQPVTGIAPVLIAPKTGAHSLKAKAPMLGSPYPGKPNGYGIQALATLKNQSDLSPGYYPKPNITYYGGQKVMPVFVTSALQDDRPLCHFGIPFDANLAQFYFWPFDGDSSSMVFLPVAQGGVTKAVLLSHLWGSTVGPDYSTMSLEVEATMNALARAQGDNTVYSLSYADLSAFTSFT